MSAGSGEGEKIVEMGGKKDRKKGMRKEDVKEEGREEKENRRDGEGS